MSSDWDLALVAVTIFYTQLRLLFFAPSMIGNHLAPHRRKLVECHLNMILHFERDGGAYGDGETR